MAALANLSPYHFAHEFSRIKKESPIHWLTRMRLEHAAIWLKFTTRSTWEIAVECGYQSREGFSRAFSRRFNRSPLEFRRQSQERLNRLARKKSVRRAACPVQMIQREAAPIVHIRQTGPYHRAVNAFNQLGQWARNQTVPLSDAGCIIINYDESDITPVLYRRYDIGLVCPDPPAMLPIMHRMILPGGVYACAKFEGSLFHLIHAWNWFIAVWLREHDFFVRDMHFFDEHPAPALLSRPMSWLNTIRRTFHCRLHIPISTYLMQGAIPISRVGKSTKNQQTARSVTHCDIF
jgi:AraC family transcriptional regulator